MFRHDKIVVAGGCFVASFFSMGGRIFAGEQDGGGYYKPHVPEMKTALSIASINSRSDYSKKELVESLKHGIEYGNRTYVTDRRRREPRVFRKEVENFCECILRGVHKYLCGIVSNYLQDVLYGSQSLKYIRRARPRFSYVGLSEDCYNDKELSSFFEQDAKILTDFLLGQVFPDYRGTVEDLHKQVAIVGKGSDFLNKAVSSAFEERKITLNVFSHFLGSGTMTNMEESNNELFLRLKNILEGGEIFQGEFISIFWETFVKRSYAFDLFDFFGNYVPASEIAYGLTVFRFVAKQETFKNLFDDELRAIIDEIDEILAKRLSMASTVLKQSPEAKKENVGQFFLRMNKRLEETKKAAEKELENNRKYSDPWYWKIEPCFNNEEEKKIFDELNESEEQVKDDGCELKKRTSKVTSKPISTQRDFPKNADDAAPGWKIDVNTSVPEVSLKYKF